MRYVAVVSGGMDSVAMAHLIKHQGHDLHLVSFDYGQRHAKELIYAKTCAARLDAQHDIVSLSSITTLLRGSALTDDTVPVPEGHYADESMKATVVPNRNMMMMSIAAAIAVGTGANGLAIGVHAGDHPIYPDCRPEFVHAAAEAINLAIEGFAELDIYTPFISQTKADIAKLGDELGVPWAETWSCYKGYKLHCGVCGTCCERIGAFMDAGVEDPTEYMDKTASIEALRVAGG